MLLSIKHYKSVCVRTSKVSLIVAVAGTSGKERSLIPTDGTGHSSTSVFTAVMVTFGPVQVCMESEIEFLLQMKLLIYVVLAH